MPLLGRQLSYLEGEDVAAFTAVKTGNADFKAALARYREEVIADAKQILANEMGEKDMEKLVKEVRASVDSPDF
eukprot:2766775-Karenia_brevis.AAC.1